MTHQDKQRPSLPRWRSVVPLRRPLRLSGIESNRGAAAAIGLSWSQRLRSLSQPLLVWPLFLFARYALLIRRTLFAVGIFGFLVLAGCGALWWRLGSGPIQFDIATPWLVSAIEENFGNKHHIQVGGTQIERTESGDAAVRLRDIVVRDDDGTVVASAPKAEVRVSGASLLSGKMRAESLNLVGAEMAIRIEQDGGVTIFAGADKHPIAKASVPGTAAAALLRSAQEKQDTGAPAAPTSSPRAATPPPATDAQAASRRARDVFAALLSWIDGIGETGLDGHDLRELGLKNGNLTVDDARTGKHWTFRDISLSAARVNGGGVEVTIGSANSERPWALSAAVTPTSQGSRKVQLEARRVSMSDLLLASRLGDGSLRIDLPLSASMSGEIGPDGLPHNFTGRIVADSGSISDAEDAASVIPIERAEFKMNWDADNRVLSLPFQILSGGNRITLLGQIDAPQDIGGVWLFKVGGGTIVLNAPAATSEPLVLNRIAMSGRLDPVKQRFVVDEGDVGNSSLGLAMSGNLDFSGNSPRLAAGLAGTRMPVDALKRIWPVFITPKVRDWFDGHLMSGTLERIVIAVNSPLEALKDSGPPVPDDGLSIDAFATNCLIRPVEGLPALHDADMTVHVVGRDAVVSIGKATAEVPSGKKLSVTSGVFEVPDTAPHAPPAKVHFKVEGSTAAAGELLRMDRLRDVSEAPFDPATIRGNLTAQVTLGMPLKADLPTGSTNYAISLEATNFSADRMIMGQKVEAAMLRANATPQGFQLKGDVKIGGAPVNLEYRKVRGEPDAEVRLQGTLDENARNNLGFEMGDAVSGAIPIRLSGRVAATADRDGRFSVEADLTPAQIEGLLPGWTKPSGKPARATFTLSTKPQTVRIEDLVIDGAGANVKGTIDFDNGEVQAANFPVYGFSDGDRASLKIERGGEGALRVVMRGEVYDGRGFVKTAAGASSSNPNPKRHSIDADLDIKLAAVVGFNGEALRGVELKMSRRAGEIRSFGLNAKIGRDATLTGDLRGRAAGRQLIYVESGDAAAFFRFTDIYSRMNGGQMALTMEAPSADNPAQQGVLLVRNFAVHDEQQLERAVTTGAQQQRRSTNAIDFSGMRVEFTRMPGRVALRDGVVRGPLLGGTIDGLVDYAHDDVHLRGTLVPLYGPNNLLGQIPIVGLFMGGDKEGLFGLTYEVVGRPTSPVLRINPISALAPGLLRKVFEFPANGGDTSSVETFRSGR
jgi:hypothetical protein